ncbi:MAG: hypothetical protein ABI367_01865 [Mucilaginibacter sp.]
MVYDCFLFNDELDMLLLRLTYMSKYVDYFVIGESTQTHSGLEKPLYFLNNISKFSQFKDKITHVLIPPADGLNAWGTEFFQRNYLKTGLKNCKDDDLIIIGDNDEFINMDHLTGNYSINKPTIIKMQLFYYFLNLKTDVKWRWTLITPYSFIKDINIGDREIYFQLNSVVLTDDETLGWHFSYMFGYDIALYQSKLKSFSHQEYNTPYFLNTERIKTCLSLGVDFLERNSVYTITDISKEFPQKLLDALDETGLTTKYVYKKPGFLFYLNFYHLKYFIKFKLKPLLKNKLNGLN